MGFPLFLRPEAVSRHPALHLVTNGSSPVSFGSINFSRTVPSRRVADQVPLISLASKDHQKPEGFWMFWDAGNKTCFTCLLLGIWSAKRRTCTCWLRSKAPVMLATAPPFRSSCPSSIERPFQPFTCKRRDRLLSEPSRTALLTWKRLPFLLCLYLHFGQGLKTIPKPWVWSVWMSSQIHFSKNFDFFCLGSCLGPFTAGATFQVRAL